MRLAFWNVRQNDDAIMWLADGAAPDILVIAECGDAMRVMNLLATRDRRWTQIAGTGPRIALFSRGLDCVPRVAADRFCVSRIRMRQGMWLTLAAVHLRSRMYASASDLSLDCSALRNDILSVEQAERDRNTLVMGDFNLDPYDFGLCDRRLLLGVMDRRLAARMEASHNADIQSAVFYNPMWSRMGDESPGPPGTYYTSTDDHHDYRFHTFDQVLVRPPLVPSLVAVTVPRRLGTIDLVQVSDLPRKADVSDHLPVIVDLEPGAADEPDQA